MKRIFIFISFLYTFSAFAQEDFSTGNERKQKVYITAAPEVGLVIPTDFGTKNDGFFNDTMVRFSPNISFRLGMNLRFDFSRLLSLQTGLYYVSRAYTVTGGVTNTERNGFESIMFKSNPIKYTGFEVPIMFLVYVQLGEKWFMNNSAGFSLDFFPSSIAKRVEIAADDYYQIEGGRNSWIRPSFKAAIGFEYRTEKSGYFYLGAQFHRPLLPLFEGITQRQDAVGNSKWVEKIMENGKENTYYRYTSQSITGTYFAVDFKYFFPNKNKNQFTSNRSRKK